MDGRTSWVALKRSANLYAQASTKSTKLAKARYINEEQFLLLDVATNGSGIPLWYRIFYVYEPGVVTGGKAYGFDDFARMKRFGFGAGWVRAEDAALTFRTGVVTQDTKAGGRQYTNAQTGPVPAGTRVYCDMATYKGKAGQYYEVATRPRTTSAGDYIFWPAIPASAISFDPVTGKAGSEAATVSNYKLYYPRSAK